MIRRCVFRCTRFACRGVVSKWGSEARTLDDRGCSRARATAGIPGAARSQTALADAQQTLIAVERFAKRHDAGELPAQANYYRDLIPFDRPQEGQQYAFDVDLDACTGCKACVAACHNLNGLDSDELWRTVGLLHGGTPNAPAQQTVTAACHHC